MTALSKSWRHSAAEPARSTDGNQPERIEFRGYRGQVLVADRWSPRVGSDGHQGIVVLLHGGGQTRHSWSRTATRIADLGWSVLTIDARGHGDSPWAESARAYDMDYLVGDLRGVLSSLDEPPVVIGASMGGMTALIAEGEHPGLGRGLILVDVVPRLEERGLVRIREFMATGREGFATLDEAADAISAYNPQRPRPTSLAGLRKNLRLRDNGKWYWHWDPLFLATEDREPDRGAGPERAEAACQGIRVPTLVVRGGRSDVITPEAVRAFQELLPEAEYFEVPEAGHMVVGDDNDVFTTAVSGFLARIPRISR